MRVLSNVVDRVHSLAFISRLHRDARRRSRFQPLYCRPAVAHPSLFASGMIAAPTLYRSFALVLALACVPSLIVCASTCPFCWQGHGRINLLNALNVNSSVGLFFIDWESIVEGQTLEYTVTLHEGADLDKVRRVLTCGWLYMLALPQRVFVEAFVRWTGAVLARCVDGNFFSSAAFKDEITASCGRQPCMCAFLFGWANQGAQVTLGRFRLFPPILVVQAVVFLGSRRTSPDCQGTIV